jgi:hypothetical protein
MPTPTINETSGGFRPCWAATIAPPIIGPIPASNRVPLFSDVRFGVKRKTSAPGEHFAFQRETNMSQKTNMSLDNTSHPGRPGLDELVPSRDALRVGEIDVTVVSDGVLTLTGPL